MARPHVARGTRRPAQHFRPCAGPPLEGGRNGHSRARCPLTQAAVAEPPHAELMLRGAGSTAIIGHDGHVRAPVEEVPGRTRACACPPLAFCAETAPRSCVLQLQHRLLARVRSSPRHLEPPALGRAPQVRVHLRAPQLLGSCVRLRVCMRMCVSARECTSFRVCMALAVAVCTHVRARVDGRMHPKRPPAPAAGTQQAGPAQTLPAGPAVQRHQAREWGATGLAVG